MTAAQPSPNPQLQQTIQELSRLVGAAQCYVYLAGAGQEQFLPLITDGSLSAQQEQDFFAHPLAPETDLLLYEILVKGAPRVLYEAAPLAAGAEPAVLAPSILSILHLERAIALPIRSGQHVTGLYLAARPAGQPFSAEQVEMAVFASNTLALVLENTRLYQETALRLQESQSLHQVTLALLQKLTLEETFEIICNESQRLTRAVGCSLALLDDPHWLRVAYHTGQTPYTGGRYPVDDSPLGLAARRAEPLLVNEPTRPTAASESPATPAAPLSLLAVPFQVRGELSGVLAVVNPRGGFVPDDARVLHRLADQASVAIEHARLLQESRRVAILEERQRLANNLHDSVNQHLYGINLFTQAAQKHLQNSNLTAAAGHLEHIQASAKDALDEMRLLIYELRPPVLENEGLVAAIEMRLKSVEERTGLKTALKARLPGRLPAQVEDELYRIAQEALNNIVKHAAASQVHIHLIHSGHTLLMRIEDNGRGFDSCQAPAAGKIGLRAMQERAAALGGALTITSQPGQGTKIYLEVSV